MQLMQEQSTKPIPAGLVFFKGQEKPRQYVIFQKSIIRGQCGMEVFSTSGLSLIYPFLDKEQCEIRFENGRWIYKNLSEGTFTFVGGKPLDFGEERELKDGMMIRIVNDQMLTAIFLEEFVGGRDWQIINMDDGRHTIQLSSSESSDEYSGISLEFERGRWTMKDFQEEHVLHNGAPVNEKFNIRIDDNIQIGDTRFFFEGSGLVYGYPTKENTLSISIDERTIQKSLKKIQLLKDINLSVEPGNLVMILGGSGAGKSTFVNAVTGYEKAKATIKEGKIDYYKDFNAVKRRIGFVPQDSLMREEDTVIATISNAADLRLPSNMPLEEKELRIKAILETFGLTGREKEFVSKLSGGQKKRLSICTEFIAEPTLFILDEPDSGLDGIMATELMENLRLIACQGKIVMVITHSPDRVAHLFDKVIVLAKSSENHVGQLAFYGGIQEAREFFGVPTMEGVVKRINSSNEGGENRADEFIQKYRKYEAIREENEPEYFTEAKDSSEASEEKTNTKSSNKRRYISRFGQVSVCLGKQLRLFFNEKNWIVFPLAAVIAFLIMYVLGSRMFKSMEFSKYGALALICICIWNGMFNSIQIVCKERDIIKREHRTGLHISAYMCSHMILQGAICLLQTLISLGVFKLMGMHFPDTGLVTGSFAVDLLISMFLVTYASDMLALMISCIVKSPTTAMTVLPFVLIIQLIFAGSVFPLSGNTAKLISKFTVSNWGINAVNIAADYNSQPSIAINTLLNKLNKDDNAEVMVVYNLLTEAELNDKLQYYVASKMHEKAYEYTVENMWKSWGVLIIFAIIYGGVGIAFLEFIDKDKR